jgi:hypothetical protein
MPKEKHICCGYNKAHGMRGVLHKAMYREWYKCDKVAKHFEDNKWYCGNHAPSKIKEREDKAWNRYIDKINRNEQLQGFGKDKEQ